MQTYPKPARYSLIIKNYQLAFRELTEKLTYADRHHCAKLIDNNLKTYINKMYGHRHFSEEEALVLLNALKMPGHVEAITHYIALRRTVSSLLTQLGLPLSFIHTLTGIRLDSFRRRMLTPELWQPEELEHLLSQLDAIGQSLHQFTTDPLTFPQTTLRPGATD